MSSDPNSSATDVEAAKEALAHADGVDHAAALVDAELAVVQPGHQVANGLEELPGIKILDGVGAEH